MFIASRYDKVLSSVRSDMFCDNNIPLLTEIVTYLDGWEL